MIRGEFLRFLQTLQGPNTTDSVCKMANLILTHIEALTPLSTQQGQRIKKIVALAQAHWDNLATNIPPIPANNEEQAVKLSRLRRMVVGPFRGFARKEVFDLDSRLVLIYGPNGTGKSSFCEALEYSLLGNVSEAENKRFRDQKEYLKNAFVNSFTAPEIVADDGEGNNISVAPNESTYRFCFVEKNRIDSFSRIAAQAPAKQTELIATLFGLESFTDFVRNFSAEIGGQYIDLQGKQALLLTQKQQTLVSAQRQIQTNNIELESILEEEQRLANTYKAGSSFEQMVFDYYWLSR